MRVQLLFSVLAAATAANAQSSSVVTFAPAVTDSPVGASYEVTLPNKGNWKVDGNIKAVSAPDGKGVKFEVSISGLPAEGGPFMYHIHEKPVPADGNCTGTGAHLDPYKRGEVPICDATKKESCQTGDLSGKYGNATESSYSNSYLDLFSSTNPGNPAYFGNLSVVVHLSNKTRISCGNFKMVSPGSNGTSSGVAMPTGTGGSHHNNSTLSATPTSTATGSGPPISPTTAPAEPTGAAARLVSGAGVLFGAALALML
ncbi:superoxide dismutase [Massariosphaeria phaeospora]|uniref:superoxide dismutase n=1 Tax=Massariosphaeria phaeospora TaxID=100035 RepID=A0A7C8M166_9PLEO|nr:superoxide dismutase [Massariosphaeria phaeospora]